MGSYTANEDDGATRGLELMIWSIRSALSLMNHRIGAILGD